MSSKLVGITFASTMLFATITSGLLLSSSSTHAADDSAVTVTEITVPSSCSMTANVSAPHVADIVNGNRAINIGKTTLSTFCNDPGGFAIYAIGYTNNELGATNVIATNNTDTIATGNTAPSNNSSWGMKVVNGASSQFPATITPYFNVATNDGYVAVPSTFTLMASRNSGTAMDSATLLDTTYGAYISPTQPVGEYNGQVLYTMVHPSSAAGPNAETMFEAAFLMQPTPPTKKTVGSNSYYKMQDMTPDICTVMSIGAEGQMVDDRDDKIYWVLKARDGKCWMTQNLDHDIVTTTDFYTPQNTDVDTAWTAERATIPSTSIDSSGNFTGWTNDNTNPYSADPGDWYFTDTYYNDACNSDPWCRYTNPSADATTLSKFSTTPYSGNGTHGHVGNYYNWTAAIASNDSSNYTTSTFDDVSKNPQTSICPAGWRLPTISSTLQDDNFTTLFNVYGGYPVTDNTQADKILLAAPLYFARTSRIQNSTLYQVGRVGYYLSSTVESGTIALGLAYDYTGIYPQGSFYRYYGFGVRCVARTGTEPKTVNRAFSDAGKTTVNISGTNYYKMQDMTSSICSNISTEQTGKLIDVRDNTIYTVGKLKDNNCWLLDNLAIDLVSVSLATLKGNTNASDTALEYLKGTRTGTASDQWATSGVAYISNEKSLIKPLLSTTYATTVPSDSMSTAGGWKLGIFYNYCATSAGTYCYDKDHGNNKPDTAIDADGDICPTGWRLPTGGQTPYDGGPSNGGEFALLYDEYNDYEAFRNALRLPLTGVLNNGDYRLNTEWNYTRSSTYATDNETYWLASHSSEVVFPVYYDDNDYHLTVRCIAK